MSKALSTLIVEIVRLSDIGLGGDVGALVKPGDCLAKPRLLH